MLIKNTKYLNNFYIDQIHSCLNNTGQQNLTFILAHE